MSKRNRKKSFIIFLIIFLLLPNFGAAASASNIGSQSENDPNELEINPTTPATSDSNLNPNSNQKANLPNLATLEEKLTNSDDGKIKIIVQLNESFTPEGQISANNKEKQQKNIKAAQEDVIVKLQAKGKNHVKNINKFQTIPYMSLEVDAEGLKALSEDENIKSITEDKIISANEEEPILSPQLTYTNNVMHTEKAWQAGYTGQGKTVAILDTGVDRTHPFLQNKVVYEGCFSTDGMCSGGNASTGTGSANDTQGHGTHVAGIATGLGASFSGVAKNANIIAIKVLANAGNGTFTDLLNGLERVYSLRYQYDISAINLSLGAGSFSSSCDSSFSSVKSIVDNLKSVGIATIAASGNEYYKSSIGAPACISSIISVGATANNDTVSSFSNSASILDLLAPGNPVVSSIPGGGYGTKSGTSMATPQVSGGFTLLRQKYPSATVDQIITYMKQNGVNVTDSANGITKPRLDFNWLQTSIPQLSRVAKPTWSGETIQWVGVSNASQYELKLYYGATLENTLRVSSASRQYNFASQMTQPGVYTVTVQAIGNSTTYRDGEVSVPSDDYRKGLVYFENFESNNGNFVASGTNNSWQWGVPTSGPNSAYSGSRVWATNLSGNYNDNELSYITSPTINLSNVSSDLTLSWKQYGITEPNYDYEYVEVSKNGGQSWERLDQLTGNINTTWGNRGVTLDSTFAVSNFKFRIGLLSDYSNVRLGLYIDDVMISGTTASIPSLAQVQKPTWSGDVIQWVGVSNASQYELKLYKGTSLISTQRVGSTIRQYNFATLMTNPGAYTVTVQAIGNGTQYRDGLVSVPSSGNRGIHYLEDFETAYGGFTPGGTNSSWQWGAPTSGPNTAYSGTKVWATNLSGNYNNGENSFIESSSINLSGASSTMNLSWMQYAVTEQNYDYMKLEVSKDGGQSWTEKYRYSGPNDTSWTSHEVELESSYAVDSFKMRFSFVTDGSVTTSGIYLDDVKISNVSSSSNLAQVQKPLWNGDVIQWNQVANASQYELKLYRGTSLVHTQLVSSSTNQYNFASFMTNPGQYTVTVRAIGNQTTYFDGPVSLPSEPNSGIYYHQSFELNNGDYSSGGTNSSWNWGIPTYGPEGAYSGSRAWATNLGGLYQNNEDSYLLSPNINLSNSRSALTLSWMQYAVMERSYDYLTVEVSKDGGLSWNQVYQETGTINPFWGHAEVNLDSSYAVSNFKVRFSFHSDYSVTYAGVYIDDVMVARQNAIPALDQVQQPTWNGNTIQWSGVSNASGYEMKLYYGTNLISTQRVDSGVRQINLDSYTANYGSYTATVQAIGDHTNYRDGQVSSPSESLNRFVVLDQVEKPTWSGDTLVWSGVANTDRYEVKLYRGAELADSYVVTGGITQYDLSSAMSLPGVYTATVQALGDQTSTENGPASIPSDENRKVVTLDQVSRPVWSTDVIKWNAVANAVQYEVKLYRGTSLISTKTLSSGTRQYNFASLMGSTGEYTVTVRALGDNNTIFHGPVSVKSYKKITLGSVAQPTWSGDVIQWGAVANANQFEVKLYRGTTLVTTQTVPSTTYQFNFASFMTSPGEYSVTVQALGSNLTYRKGPVSQKSNTKITIATVSRPVWSADTIKWTAVPNASQYEVKLYRGTSLVSTKTLSSTTLSYDFASLMGSTGEYTVTVRALGDNGVYRSGSASVKSYKKVTLATVAAPTWSGDVIKWTSVPNASQYEVKLYRGTTLISTQTVPATTYQYDFASSMASSGQYTVTVRALGSNLTYRQGPVSLKSNVKTTLSAPSRPVWSGDVIKWNAVADVSQYEVKLYRGTSLVSTKTLAATALSYNFASLMGATGEYTVTVRALGDNVDFRSGPASVNSYKKITLAQVAQPTWSGDIIKWTAVSNANQYQVKLYRGTTLVSTQTVSSTTYQYNFASLMTSRGEYTVTVQALGSNLTYRKGPVSIKSVVRIK